MRRARLLVFVTAAFASLAGVAHAQGMARRAWLGIGMEDATAADPGVHVTKVAAGSPAEKAGLKEGDRVLKVDGSSVTTARDVQRVVGSHASGDVLTVTVKRAGGDSSLRISLAPRPSPDEQMRLEHVGKFAPAWIGVEGARGDVPRNVSALRGKVVVVDFWATWCSACRMAAPTLNGWQARYGAQGLSVVGITSSDDKETAATFATKTDMRFNVASDESGATARAYDVSALPTMFVIDKRGVVRDVAIGFDPDHEAHVEALIRQLLAEPAPSP